MNTNETYTITPYSPADDAGLAQMWNASDDQWPGTFTGGVPMTTERVTKWMREEDCLLRLIVKTSAGQVVGYGSLRDLPGREHQTAYVPLLNVQPDHQGQSLCRRMLTQMVDHATVAGYERLTLGTWAANIKSVPLYKKVGFFWIPETSVGMSNYVPLVRQLAVIGGFFDRADWYTDYKRALEMEEDAQTHPHFGEQQVFISRWEKDGAFVEATIDRKAQTLTGLETERFGIFAYAENNEPTQGLAYSMTWTVVNKSDEPMAVGLAVEGDEGIEVAGDWSGVVPAGTTHTHTTTYICSTQAPTIRLASWRPKPTPQITSRVTINGQPLRLGIGLHYKQAVEVSVYPELMDYVPGREHTPLLQLHNTLNTPLTGTLSAANQIHPYTIPAKGLAGVPITLTASQTQKLAVDVTWTKDDGRTTDESANGQPLAANSQSLPTIHYPLLSRSLGQIAALRVDDTIWVANDFFTMKIEELAGRVEVRNKVGLDSQMWFREELGSPFEPPDCKEKKYDMALDVQPGRVNITLSVNSTRFPGLTCTRHLTITPSPVMEMHHSLTNNGQQTHTVKVKSIIRFADSEIEKTEVALARQERIVVDNGTQFPLQDGDYPRNPADVPEQWVCYRVDGQALGAIWPPENSDHELEWGFLRLQTVAHVLEPGQTKTLDPLHLFNGPGRWQDVRRLWQQLNDQPCLPKPETGPMNQLSTLPNPILTTDNEVTATVQLDTVRNLALQGELQVNAPAGWHTNDPSFPISDLTSQAPFTHSVTFTTDKARLGVATGQLHFNGKLNDIIAPLNLIRLGDSSQKVTVSQEDNGNLWQIANGLTQFNVTPNFHAGVSAWRTADGQNHLHSPYPEPGMFDWMSPWFGGIWPTLRYDADDWGNIPGNFHKSGFSVTTTQQTDDHALTWQGVTLSATPSIKQLEGLKVELSYLTLPGSNVLKLIFRVINPTSVYRRATPSFFLFCALDGQAENGTLHSSDLVRKHTANDNWAIVKEWVAVENPKTGKAMIIVAPTGREQAILMDWGKFGGHLWIENDTVLPPHSHHDLIGYVALTDSIEAAKKYAVLNK